MKYILTQKIIFIFLICLARSAFAENILIVSPEQSEIFQTGGLAHATTGLAVALNHEGVTTDVLMPFYTEMNAPNLVRTGELFEVPLDWQNGSSQRQSKFSLFKNNEKHNPTYFLKHENGTGTNYFENPSHGGKKYYGPEFFIGEAVAAWAKASSEYILSKNYDVVILNDWTTGLIAYHLHQARSRGVRVPKVIFAVHNLAYQGLFPESLANFLGIPKQDFNIHGVEYYANLGMLKAGLQYADMIYTVSPQYAKEITTERFGVGLQGLLKDKARANKLIGILNGIDNHEWDPSAKVAGLNYEFSPQNMHGKNLGKLELQGQMNLPVKNEVPVFVFTSRLAEQKGTAYLADAIEDAARQSDSQFIIMGDGDEQSVNRMRELARELPHQVKYLPFSSKLEKKLMRYADFFVNASWFEPSGLNQLFALRQGTLPVVSAAGGLINSVENGKTGLLFDIIPSSNGGSYDIPATRASVAQALLKARELYRDTSRIELMREAAMNVDNSWQSRVHTDIQPMLDYVRADAWQNMSFKDYKKQVVFTCEKLF